MWSRSRRSENTCSSIAPEAGRRRQHGRPLPRGTHVALSGAMPTRDAPLEDAPILLRGAAPASRRHRDAAVTPLAIDTRL
jgi:hypothetical protein